MLSSTTEDCGGQFRPSFWFWILHSRPSVKAASQNADMTRCLWRPMSMILIACIWPSSICNAWTANTNEELRDAIKQCLKQSADCSRGPRGPIGSWDINEVINMCNLFVVDEHEEHEHNPEKNTDAERDTGIDYTDSAIPGADKFNGDLSKWDVLNVINMHSMFQYASSFNADLSKWDVSSVTYMGAMFGEATVFNADLSKWDVSSVTDMGAMFAEAICFNADISKWDVYRVTDMGAMFGGATGFNADLSEWDVSSATNMGAMFTKAFSFNADLSKWDVSRVTDMGGMFEQTIFFNADLSKWDVSSVTNMVSMFSGATSFAGTLCGAWFASTADKDGMFDGSSGKICRVYSNPDAKTPQSSKVNPTEFSPSSKEELKSAVECLYYDSPTADTAVFMED